MAKIISSLFVFLFAIAVGVGIGALFALPIMWLWNALLPDIFGFKEISWLQAWGLNVLAVLLIKSSTSTTSK